MTPPESDLLPDYHRLRLVFDVAVSLTTVGALGPLLQSVVRLCRAQMQADACVVLLGDEKGELIPYVADSRDPRREVLLSDPAVSRIIAKPQILEDDGRSGRTPTHRGTYVPLLSGSDLLGILCVVFEADSQHRLEAKDARALEVVAGLVGAAVGTAQLLAALQGHPRGPLPTYPPSEEPPAHVVAERKARPAPPVDEPEVLRSVKSQIERLERALAELLHDEAFAREEVQRQRAEWHRRGVRAALRQLKQAASSLIAESPDGTVWVGDAMFFELAIDELSRASAQVTNVLEQLDEMAARPEPPDGDRVAYIRGWSEDLIRWLQVIRKADQG